MNESGIVLYNDLVLPLDEYSSLLPDLLFSPLLDRNEKRALIIARASFRFLTE